MGITKFLYDMNLSLIKGFIRKGHIRKGHIRKGHIRKGHIRKGHIRKGHKSDTVLVIPFNIVS